VHFQYIMASDRRCPYDYVLLIGGPVAIAEWAKRHWELTLSFIWDGKWDESRDGRRHASSLPSPAPSLSLPRNQGREGWGRGDAE